MTKLVKIDWWALILSAGAGFGAAFGWNVPQWLSALSGFLSGVLFWEFAVSVFNAKRDSIRH